MQPCTALFVQEIDLASLRTKTCFQEGFSAHIDHQTMPSNLSVSAVKDCKKQREVYNAHKIPFADTKFSILD